MRKFYIQTIKISTRCTSIVFLVILQNLIIQSKLLAQDDNYILHLKNGQEVIGRVVCDTTFKQYLILTDKKSTVRTDLNEVEFITQPEQVIRPPEHNVLLPFGEEINCRSYKPYFFDAGIIGIKAGSLGYGGEMDAGIRFNKINAGIGVGGYFIDKVFRTPLYFQLKYYMNNDCIRYYTMFNAGYIFDKFTSRYNITPSIKYINESGPKFLSAALGVEYPIIRIMSLAFEGGYKYMTLTREEISGTCDGLTKNKAYTEYQAVYLKIGVAF